ncbi:hypothetical protein AB0943_35315, partial [Streptomyces sp. NPDC007044]
MGSHGGRGHWRRSDTKRFRHPVVGELELDCEVLLSP